MKPVIMSIGSAANIRYLSVYMPTTFDLRYLFYLFIDDPIKIALFLSICKHHQILLNL